MNTFLIFTIIALVQAGIIVWLALKLFRRNLGIFLEYQTAVDAYEELVNVYAHQCAIKRGKTGSEAYKKEFAKISNELREKLIP
jgi:hypothetical protein